MTMIFTYIKIALKTLAYTNIHICLFVYMICVYDVILLSNSMNCLSIFAAGEKAQLSKALAALPEYLGPVPRAPWQLTTMYSSCPRGSNVLFQFL